MKKRQNRNLWAAGTTLLSAETVLAATHSGGIGVIVGAVLGVAAYVAADDLQRAIAGADEDEEDEDEYEDEDDEEEEDDEDEDDQAQPSLAYRLFNGKSVREQNQDKQQDTTDDIFSLEQHTNPLPFERLGMKAILAHIPENSYCVYLGRSVLLDKHPARSVNIFKQHIKIIGASQKGKSSMAACILEQIIKTHDLDHALIALLDLEDRTGKLFENDPHIVTFRMSGQDVKMHARTKEQVLEYLGYIVQLMDYRYTLPVSEVEDMPILIVYVEEFLALKDHFKLQCSLAKDKERAQRDYDDLIYRISELARRGLKARIQLLLCAQVDYADDDFKEALANITVGMSFCVKPSAAQAAGFTDTALLRRNRKDNIVSQAVAEFSGCKDLMLAPNYDLQAKLIKREEKRRSTKASQRAGFDRDAWAAQGEAGERHSQEDRDRGPMDPQPRQKVDTLVARGADAWQEGEQSIDKLANRLGINFNQARQLKPKVLDEVRRREMDVAQAEEQA